tara:strand:- start:559 stop:1386 length:828 start_codon:yes stop_codon:yes gene_type:complete
MQNNEPIWIKKNQEKKKSIGLFVATPVHSDVSIHYAQTMLELQKECIRRNIRVMFQLMKSSLVTQGRNLCVSGFLQSDYTHLLFVDSDIAFDVESIFKMLDKDKEIISQPYPIKSPKWETLVKKYDAGFIKKPQDCQLHINQYPILLKDDDHDIDFKDGVVEVTHAPTGCMLIKRNVFDKLHKAYPNMDIKQKTVIDGKFRDRPHLYAYFDTYYDPETKRYFGEDFAFCRLWKNIGGKLYAYIMDYITHVGEFQYTGRLYDEMIKQEVDKPCDSE